LAAIRRAARELGRAPSRGELKRLQGVSHYRVLSEFKTLREAVRAAGLEPSRKGERVDAEELIADWKRVSRKLGKRPSRSEYVREGRYSAGTFVARFGAWSAVGNDKPHHGDTEARRKAKRISHKEHGAGRRQNGSHGKKAMAFEWAAQLARVPGPVRDKRRVTEAVAAMVVGTLLPGARHSAPGLEFNQNPFTTEGTKEHRGRRAREVGASGAVPQAGKGQFFSPRSPVASVVRKDRPVMGAPFNWSPLTNAPVNEMGVVFLWAIVAGRLGFQVESMQGRYPDCEAKREVAPGKWQRMRIEIEYESKNFKLHGHDPRECDVIVCWKHNWKECPEEIEVVELCGMLEL
jgi:hypothetical protein